jgi:hypothetical protein
MVYASTISCAETDKETNEEINLVMIPSLIFLKEEHVLNEKCRGDAEQASPKARQEPIACLASVVCIA